MERKLKFRAWWPMVKKMAHFGKDIMLTSDGENYGYMFTTSDTTYMGKSELMQFTGLLDKNGKEIYEGDIIKLDEMVCPITWGDGAWMMITDKNSGRAPAIQERTKRFEIVGNIYENPELLNP